MPHLEIASQHFSVQELEGKLVPTHTLQEISALDNKVFSGEPWYEGDFCDECSAMKLIKESTAVSEVCVSCGSQVISLQTRMRKIGSELARDLAYVALVRDQNEILIGYGWGFQFESPAAFVQAKYKTETTRANVLKALTAAGLTESFYYYSGMGIESSRRGLGLSNLMGKLVDEYARSQNLPGLTRTLSNSPIVTMRQKLGFRIVVGPDIDPPADLENPNRVLLVRN